MNIEKNILDFRLDYLVTYGTFLFESDYFDILNFENSATSKFGDYGIVKVDVPRHQYKIIFSYGNNTVYAYEKGELAEDNAIRSHDKIIIYGTAFRLLEKEKIYSFLKNNFELRHNQRIDICADVNIDIEDLLLHVDTAILKDSEKRIRDNKVATQYIGNRDKYSNKRYIIRFYNKLLDILEKNKLWFYGEYLPEKYVTRCEVEIRPLYAKNIHWESLFDIDKLQGVFLHHISKFTPLFDFIDSKKVSLLHPYDVNEQNFQSFAYDDEKKKLSLRIANLIGRAKSLDDMGFDPISLLIKEGIYGKAVERAIGKEILTKIVHEEARQKNIARKHLYKRKISSNQNKDG